MTTSFGAFRPYSCQNTIKLSHLKFKIELMQKIICVLDPSPTIWVTLQGAKCSKLVSAAYEKCTKLDSAVTPSQAANLSSCWLHIWFTIFHILHEHLTVSPVLNIDFTILFRGYQDLFPCKISSF